MDHAEARERIADLALEPRRVLDLESDRTPEADDLLAHVSGCPACQAELDAWRQTHTAVLEAVEAEGGQRSRGAGPGWTEPPAALRAAVAAIPGRSPRLLAPGMAPKSNASVGSAPEGAAPAAGRQKGWQLAAVAAVMVIALVVGLGAIAADRARLADIAQQQAGELAGLAESLGRVMRDPGHAAIALTGSDGMPVGTAAWSADEVVVLTTALMAPGAGAEYRCWIERDGRRTPIGVMRFDRGVAYWSGPLSSYGGLSLSGGGRLGVSLETVGEGGTGAPVLVGELPS
jgi:hypothetical protein